MLKLSFDYASILYSDYDEKMLQLDKSRYIYIVEIMTIQCAENVCAQAKTSTCVCFLDGAVEYVVGTITICGRLPRRRTRPSFSLVSPLPSNMHRYCGESTVAYRTLCCCCTTVLDVVFRLFWTVEKDNEEREKRTFPMPAGR